MRFCEKLNDYNDYIEQLNCTAKEIGELSEISPATLSRYRSGERVPGIGSIAFEKLCSAITVMYSDKNIDLPVDKIRDSFLECDDLITVDKEKLCRNFDVLVSVLDLNLAKLCKRIITIFLWSRVFAAGRDGRPNPKIRRYGCRIHCRKKERSC